jgi:hypothetical protein
MCLNQQQQRQQSCGGVWAALTSFLVAGSSRSSASCSSLKKSSSTTTSTSADSNTAAAKSTTTKQRQQEEEEVIPSTWSEAIHRFFLGKDIGPLLVVLTISTFIYQRYELLSINPPSITELSIFITSILFWWVQEYFIHRVLLHSTYNWFGKSYHRQHHHRNYYHVAIDPPELLLGWLFTAHFIIRMVILPNQHQHHLCLSATIGYSLAGLVYEWSHYIVHTKVQPPSSSSSSSSSPSLSSSLLMKWYTKMRENHMQHHLIDSRYWYAFSVTQMDDLFWTNPDCMELKEKKRLATMKKRVG